MAMFNPAHPGELIRETLEALFEETGKRLTVKSVAESMDTTRKTLSAILNAKQSISPEMAVKLAACFKNTSPEFWLHVQDNYDLAQIRNKVDTKRIKVLWAPKQVLRA